MKFKPRYELTFIVDDSVGDAVVDFGSQAMSARAEQQRISDYYYDSADFGERAETKFTNRRECRIRQIDASPTVWLQSRKWRAGRFDVGSRKLRQSTLRQVSVPACELDRLASPQSDESWSGDWFQEKLAKHELRGSLEVSWDRRIAGADSPVGPVRMTVDREVRFHSPVHGIRSSLQSESIVRLKFCHSLPAVFKRLIHEFSLLPDRTSLYRQCAIESVAQSATRTPGLGFRYQHSFATGEVATCQLG